MRELSRTWTHPKDANKDAITCTKDDEVRGSHFTNTQTTEMSLYLVAILLLMYMYMLLFWELYLWMNIFMMTSTFDMYICWYSCLTCIFDLFYIMFELISESLFSYLSSSDESLHVNYTMLLHAGCILVIIVN